MKTRLILICVLLGSLLTPSCNKSDAVKPVMVILKDHISYWESVKDGIDEACQEFNVTSDIRWTSADGDYQAQIDALSDYRKNVNNYSALVIAPINKNVCDYLENNLNDTECPLVIMDSPLSEGCKLAYSVYVGTDNFQAGVDLANEAKKDRPGILTENVVIFKLSTGDSMAQRAAGIQSILPSATIVPVSENEAEALATIAAQASGADVLFGTNLVNTSYLAQAVYTSVVAAKPIYGFDESDFIQARIADGTIIGTMVQKSKEIGYFSIINALIYSEKKENKTKYLSTEYKSN